MKKTRRQVIAGLGLFGGSALIRGPWDMFIDAMASGLISKVHADDGDTPRNYIHIEMFGAPARWVFDTPVFIHSDEATLPGINPNRMVKTHMVQAGSTVSFQYGVVPTVYKDPQTQKTYQMPYMWQFNVPSVGGGMRPMQDLLKHMLIIRGVDMEVDGHSSNLAKQAHPNASGASLDGAVTDGSNRFMPTVRAGSVGTYRSKKGLGALRIGPGANVVDSLTDPFRKQGLNNYGGSREEIVNRVLGRMEELVKAQAPGMAPMYKDRSNARSLIMGGLDELAIVFPQLKAKYEDLMFRAMRGTNLPGLTSANYYGLTVTSPNPGGTERDMTDNAGPVLRLSTGQTMAQLLANARVVFLAEYFAMTEYLITRSLTHSVVFDPGPLFVDVQNAQNILTTPPTLFTGPVNVANDQHQTGEFGHILLNTMYFRAMSSCLLELIEALKVKNMWTETVIHLSSEFNRAPRHTQGGGSDHGFRGHSVSIFSGAITSFQVVGNILKEPPVEISGGEYTGTWGVAANISYKDGRAVGGPLKVGNVTSTLAHLLRVEKPTPNDSSVVVESETGVEPVMESPKVKA